MTPEVEALAQRLEEVEKQVAHLAALVTELSDTDRTVAARSFVVRDEQGNRRVELGMMTPVDHTEARPCLALFDHDDARMLFTLPDAGPMLLLTHGKSKAAVYIGIDDHGPGIHFADANGKRRLNVAVSPQDEPIVAMYDANGKLRLNLQADSAGEPVLVMHDGNAEPRLYLELSSTGQPSLVMRDARGDTRVNLSIENDEPCLKFGEDNKVSWSAP